MEDGPCARIRGWSNGNTIREERARSVADYWGSRMGEVRVRTRVVEVLLSRDLVDGRIFHRVRCSSPTRSGSGNTFRDGIITIGSDILKSLVRVLGEDGSLGK